MNSLLKVSPYSRLNFQGKDFFTQNWCNIALNDHESFAVSIFAISKDRFVIRIHDIKFHVLNHRNADVNFQWDSCCSIFIFLCSVLQIIVSLFIRPSLRRDVLWYTNVRLSVRLSVRPFYMSRTNLRTPWPIHFKFHRVIGMDGLTVCLLYGEISNFHSRVMGLYSSNCRRFFVCRAVN